MDCLECGGKTQVIDSGQPGKRYFFKEAGEAEGLAGDLGINPCVIRVRKCKECNHKFATIEGALEDMKEMLG